MDYEKLNAIAESEISDSSGIARGLKDYIFWVRNKLWLVMLITVVGIVLGIFVHVKSPSIYRANASIEVERVERGDSLETGQGNNFRTEAYLGGDAIINTVTQKLLVPEILTAMVEASEPKLYEREDIIKLSFLKNLRTTDEALVLEPSQLVNMMLGEGWIRVVPRKKSYIVDIIVEHTSAEVAHQIANGILEASKKNVENKINEETNLNVKLANQMVSGAEKEILELGERLSLYNACFLRKTLIDKAEEELAELKKRYGPKWPALIEAENKLQSHKGTFDNELKQVSIISPVEKDYWDNLPQEIDKIINVQNRGQFITAELKSKEDLRNNLLSKIDSLVVGNKSSREFSVAMEATLPGGPVGPSFVKTFGLFFVGALASGIGLAILIGFLDPSVRTVAELEEYTGFPILGAIPQSLKVNQETVKKGSRSHVLLFNNDNHSPTAESIRNLRAGLSFLGDKEDRRTFMFTSAVPGEGKSFASANVANSFASQNEKTLLVDLDLRKPVQHNILQTERAPGFSDFISNQMSFEEVAKPTQNENLFFISSGSRSGNPSELMTTKNIKKLLSSIPNDFERIVFDTPPLIPVRDSLPVSKLVDSAVILYRMGSTHRKAISRILKLLNENNADPVGIVANGMPEMKKSTGYYGYYGNYYYGNYAYSYYGSGSYYGEEEDQEEEKSG